MVTIPNLQVRVSTDALIASSGNERQIYDKSIKIFGQEHTAVVVFHDDNLFVPSKLKKIKLMSKKARNCKKHTQNL